MGSPFDTHGTCPHMTVVVAAKQCQIWVVSNEFQEAV